MTWQSPILAIVGLLLALSCIVILWRKIRERRSGLKMLALGLGLIGLSVGGPILQLSRPGKVLVLVDDSASTRIADYRDLDVLQPQIRRLIGNQPSQILFMSPPDHWKTIGTIRGLIPDQNGAAQWPGTPDADAVILFSDGRFDLPDASPPVYIVKDVALAQAKDNRILNLKSLSRSHISAQVHIETGPMIVRLEQLGVAPVDQAVDVGEQTLHFQVPLPGSQLTVRLLPANWHEIQANPAGAGNVASDPWPENDQLVLMPTTGIKTRRLLIGNRLPPAGWTRLDPADLARNDLSLEDVSVIALIDPDAGDFLAAGAKLRDYVLNSGGQLIIACAQGSAVHDPLEELSPLSRHIQRSNRQWAILLDASGSMNQSTGPSSRWQQATSILPDVLAGLPGEQAVSVGGFSDQAKWWITRQPAEKAIDQTRRLDQHTPGGPTHIAAALDAFVALASDPAPTPAAAKPGDAEPLLDAVLITDAQDTLKEADAYIAKFKQHHIRLHSMALDYGPARPELERISIATGGHFITSTPPKDWARDAQRLIQDVDAGEEHRPWGKITPVDDARTMPNPWPLDHQATTQGWLINWLKQDAQLLANILSPDQPDQPTAGAAIWQRGNGRVMGLAWSPSEPDINTLGRWIERQPMDPNLSIDIATDRTIVVNAIKPDGSFINGLKISVSISDHSSLRWKSMVQPAAPYTLPLQQTAPGRYELPGHLLAGFDWSKPLHLGLRIDAIEIAMAIAPPGYSPEFRNIGLDEPALSTLARSTGGAVVDLSHPPKIGMIVKPFDLTSAGLIAGAVMSLLGMIWQMIAMRIGQPSAGKTSPVTPAA